LDLHQRRPLITTIAGSPPGKLRSFTIWIFEILGEAIGTTLCMAILMEIMDNNPYSTFSFTELGRFLLVMPVIVLWFFGVLGYLVTTLLAALYLPRCRWYLYPLVSFALYLAHSTAFYLAGGWSLLHWDRLNLAIQIGGSITAFLLTCYGDRLRRSAWPRHQPA
jgi:hypothetical protein